jgi:hypothetical protein
VDFAGSVDAPAFARALGLAAMLLAVGGLVPVARAYGRQVGVTLGVAAWVVADAALDAFGVSGWPVAAAAGVVVAVVLLVLARPRGVLDAQPPAGPWPVVYSGVSILVAFLLLRAAEPVAGGQGRGWPAWAPLAVVVLTVLLVVAGVVNALALPAPTGAGRARTLWPRGRVLAALAVTAVGGAAAVVLGIWALGEPPAGPDLNRTVVDALPFLLPGLVLACALLAGGLRPNALAARPARSVLGWAAAGVVAVVSVVGTAGVVLGADRFLEAPRVLLSGPAGLADRLVDGAVLVVGGIMAGATLAVLALLPRALSTPDGPAPPPAPTADLPQTLELPAPVR